MVRPEHRPPVQVEHRGAALRPVPQRRKRRRATGLLGQSGAGHPEDARLGDRVEVQFVGVDLQVRRLGLAVEVQREVVRREDLAEGHRRRVLLDGAHPAVVDVESLERLVDVLAERVGPGAADHRAAVAEPGDRDRDVGRGAAQVLPEGHHLRQRHTGLQRVDVNPDAAHRDDVEGAAHARDLRWDSRAVERPESVVTPVYSARGTTVKTLSVHTYLISPVVLIP